MTVKETINAIFAVGDGNTIVARYISATKEWRIKVRGLPEETTYYTDDADDAIGTAKLMYDAHKKTV